MQGGSEKKDVEGEEEKEREKTLHTKDDRVGWKDLKTGMEFLVHCWSTTTKTPYGERGWCYTKRK